MTMMTLPRSDERVAASFRDPSGYVFKREGVLLRQVNQRYREDYDLLMSSGLYQRLAAKGLLIEHTEVDVPPLQAETAYKVIQPAVVPFISYPFEWSFSALKDAALTTLRIHRAALRHGMVLKDASAYNIQFIGSRPVLIDTLSFARYVPGEPWIAYAQFCRHFLAPLALMAMRDVRLSLLLQSHIDGIPLDLTASLLPWKARLKFGLLIHLISHAKAQSRYADAGRESSKKLQVQVSPAKMNALIENLIATVQSLDWTPAGTEWGDYYSDTNYSNEALDGKGKLVRQFIERLKPRSVWDLGANTGLFSRLGAQMGAYTLSADIDPAAVEKNYRAAKQASEANLLALRLDLTNPSPAIGWANEERQAFYQRGHADVALGLALIHHLAIGNNTPLPDIARFFARLCDHLVLEFVPKEDSQVKRLLATREDIFPDYTEEGFEKAFTGYFDLLEKTRVPDACRTLYLLKRKADGALHDTESSRNANPV
jgi:ribosomal protein L11 methylase PrmA